MAGGGFVSFPSNIPVHARNLFTLIFHPFLPSGAKPWSAMGAVEQLSAYELERLENIRQNEEHLAQLGLLDGGGLIPKKAAAARRPAKNDRMPLAAPERRSARNQGVKAPGFYVDHELARGSIRVGGDARALAKEAEEDKERSAKAKKMSDPLTRFGHDAYPEEEGHLLEGEKYAFRALRDARRATAKELQLEGYKIAHNRSLCEMVRLLPESPEELSKCWGFGGSGKRVRDFGDLFLGVLAPRVKKLREVHEAARKAWEARVPEEEESPDKQGDDKVGGDGAGAASAAEMLELMPQSPDDLIEAETEAYAALIDATHVRAEEIGEKYVWNIALSRSLCEMVRRCPRTMEALRECWGFGGAGLKAQKHGAVLLAALEQWVPSIEAAHAALRTTCASAPTPASTDADAAAAAEAGPSAAEGDGGKWTRANRSAANVWEAALDAMAEVSPQSAAALESSKERSAGRTGGKRKAASAGKSTDVEAAPRRRTRLSVGRSASVA